MADQLDDEEIEEGEEAAAGGGLMKLLLFVGAPVLLIIIGLVVAFFLGVFDDLLGSGEEETKIEEQEEKPDALGHFFELEEMLVSMGRGGRRSNFLKLRISLELEKVEDEQRITALMPRILDSFQLFLRGLRIEELQGSHGLYRIKEELLVRVNAAAKPVRVKDVLFKEMLVQ